ncbi:MAG: CHAT domain-containing protein, partial [Bacteroidales bacterium]
QADYKISLDYYQKSLIAIVSDFNNSDIYSNPQVDSSLFDIRLLDNLKSKAQALELLANEQSPDTKLHTISKSLETIELVLDLIEKIRNNYLTEESRIYLAENEKETYLFAVHISGRLFALKGEGQLKSRIYGIAEKAKAAVLRNEIAGNEFLYLSAVPDSALKKRNSLASQVAAYTGLIIEELRKTRADSNKISLWKDALFDMNRELEKITEEINLEFPQYHEIMRKTSPAALTELQKHLHGNETIVEYLLSNRYKDGKRALYTFVITRDNLEFREAGLDSLFSVNAEIIRNAFLHHEKSDFREFTGALASMYGSLIKPVRELFAGKNLIIIPDEEISRLPFEAFLPDKPGPDQNDYEGLKYLIHSYSISYCYYSSLIFANSFPVRWGEEVLSFAPYYDKTDNGSPVPASLKGTSIETGSIYRWFRGTIFEGNRATETNFRLGMQKPAIFHLAMHSVSDSADSRYSYLMFDSYKDTLEDGRLYNYEISLSRMRSPMVVLSACNSGAGTLYHGEGLMSLARGFILAGASSVIKTSWEVNDEISADIISRFYKHLSEGRHKDDALRLAKLGYLNESLPAYSGPYYWAAYEVLGNNAPVKRSKWISVSTGLVVIISCVILIFYLRRRKIFSDRSL